MISRVRIYKSPDYLLLVGFLGEQIDSEDVKCRILTIHKTRHNQPDPKIQDQGIFSMSQLYKFMNDERTKYEDRLILKCECWGIIGLFKLLHCHYLLLIRSRKYLGNINGHRIYEVAQTQRICLGDNFEHRSLEQRYLRLFNLIDLNSGFYFSYTYALWQNLQTNILVHDDNSKNLRDPFLSQFVWNSFLSSVLRESNERQTPNAWVVPLVHGFIEQRQFQLNNQQFKIMLISRRSRLCAGARYHRRGLDRNGRVANFVESEQIVISTQKSEEIPRISSIVQVRGSVPLFWSQKASTFKPRPEIHLYPFNQVQYKTTIKHFNHLVHDYGKLIVVLNLLRQKENHREMMLRDEYTQAVSYINQCNDLNSQISYFPIDIKSENIKAQGVLKTMQLILEGALSKTGFFVCNPNFNQPNEKSDQSETNNDSEIGVFSNQVGNPQINEDSELDLNDSTQNNAFIYDFLGQKFESSGRIDQPMNLEDQFDQINFQGPIQFQNGVLRTNCVDCLDRTNVAQFTFGLCALSQQLISLNIGNKYISTDSSMAQQLMNMYERTGNALAVQYGGSNAHSKVFSKQRGERWERAKLKDMFVSMRRYYSNTIVDPDKQDGIDLFLGNYVPQVDRPHIWEVEKEEGVRYINQERILKQYQKNSCSFSCQKSVGSQSQQFSSYQFPQVAEFAMEESKDSDEYQLFQERMLEKVKDLSISSHSPFFCLDKMEEESFVTEEESVSNLKMHNFALQSGLAPNNKSRKYWGPVQLNGMDKSVDGQYIQVQIDKMHLPVRGYQGSIYPARSASLGSFCSFDEFIHDKPPTLSRHSIHFLNTGSERMMYHNGEYDEEMSSRSVIFQELDELNSQNTHRSNEIGNQHLEISSLEIQCAPDNLRELVQQSPDGNVSKQQSFLEVST